MTQRALSDKGTYEYKIVEASFRHLSEKYGKLKLLIPEMRNLSEVILQVKTSRSNFQDFFKQPCLRGVCSDCYEGYNRQISPASDFCCSVDYGSNMQPYELIYLAVIDFQIPEPDWVYLEREIGSGRGVCAFSSPEGCLLRENRRIICLYYYCQKFLDKIIEVGQNGRFLSLKQGLAASYESFFGQVMRDMGPKLDSETAFSIKEARLI